MNREEIIRLEMKRRCISRLIDSNHMRGYKRHAFYQFLKALTPSVPTDYNIDMWTVGDRSFEDYVIFIRDSFPVFQKLDVHTVAEFIKAYLLGGGNTSLHEDMLLFLARPEYAALYTYQKVSYLEVLIQNDATELFFRKEEQFIFKHVFEKFKVKFDFLVTDEAESRMYEVRRAIVFAAYITLLSKATKKVPDFNYWRKFDASIESIVSLGFTHDELYTFALNGNSTPSSFTDWAHTVVSKEMKTYIIECSLDKMEGGRSSLSEYLARRIWQNTRSFRYITLLPTVAEAKETDYSKTGALRWAYDAQATGRWADLMLENSDLHNDIQGKIVKWLYKHRNFYNSTIVHRNERLNESVPIHMHTLIKRLLTGVNYPEAKAAPDPKATPTEFLELHKDVLDRISAEYIKERTPFDAPPFELKSFSYEEGDEVVHVSFQQLMDTNELKNEGVVMHHCIGGYGKTMAKEGNFAFHINSTSNARGYTLHVSYNEDRAEHYVSQIRGAYNADAPDGLSEGIMKQLNDYKLEVSNG